MFRSQAVYPFESPTQLVQLASHQNRQKAVKLVTSDNTNKYADSPLTKAKHLKNSGVSAPYGSRRGTYTAPFGHTRRYSGDSVSRCRKIKKFGCVAKKTGLKKAYESVRFKSQIALPMPDGDGQKKLTPGTLLTRILHKQGWFTTRQGFCTTL